MTFGFTAAFWFAMLAIPIAAVFFYRRTANERIIPALDIWEMLGSPVASKSVSSRLRRWLSLLLQILMLMLLVLALADPTPPKKRAGRTIIVLDVSATMQTRDGTSSRMDLAKQQARAALADMAPEGEVAILRIGPGPILALGVTKSIADATKVIDATESLDADADIARGLDSARAFLNPQVDCEVVVISDFVGADLGAIRRNWSEAGAHLVLRPIGRKTPDAAINGLWAEQIGTNRRITARIAQNGMSGVTVPVRLNVDGHLAQSKMVTLADKPVLVDFLQQIEPGSAYEVVMDSGDGLAVDDRAAGVAARQELRSVCLVTEGDLPLERALRADPTVQLRVVTPGGFTGPLDDSVVVVEGALNRPGQPGSANYLFIGAADPFGWSRKVDFVPAKPISQWTGDHPSLADVDPTLFKVSQLLRMQWQPGAKVSNLIGAGDLPVVVERSSAAGDGGRVLYWLFDLNDTDLPQRITFPLLLWNTVDYLATGGKSPTPDSGLTGRPLRLAATSASAPVVTDPAGRVIPTKPASDGWLALETFKQGIYRRSDTGEPLALNLLSDRATKAMGVDDSPAAEADASAISGQTLSLWAAIRRKISCRSVLAVVAALGLIEWVLFHRRVIRIS